MSVDGAVMIDRLYAKPSVAYLAAVAAVVAACGLAGVAAADERVVQVQAQQVEAAEVLIDVREAQADAAPEGLRPANAPGDANADDRRPKAAVSEHETGYRITWHSLSTNANVEVDTGSTSAHMSLNGQLEIPETRDPAAYIIEVDDVLDTAGRSLMNQKLSKWSGRSNNWPVQRINQNQGNRNAWGVNASLGQLVQWSTDIDRITGRVHLLEVTETESAQMPLAPSDKPVPICAGVTIQIEKVDRRSNSLTVNYKIGAADPAKLNDLASPPFLHRQVLLDEAGNELPVGSAYASINGPNEGYMRFYLQNAEDGPVTVRFIMATAVDEVSIPFELVGLSINPVEKAAPGGAAAEEADGAAGEAEALAPAPAADQPAVQKPGNPFGTAPVRRGIDGQRFEK